MTVTIDGSNGITFPNSSTQAVGFYGFKNRIINGGMNINQYGLSGTATALGSSAYNLVDRFQSIVSQGSKLYAGYNTGSVTPPGGFQNYLAFTCGATATLGASDYFGMWQKIEANNVTDIQWGTANAVSMTLSFWVYSNTTGTFGGSVQNAAQTRSYPFVYTVASSNTWQKITVTVPGDTSGSWTLNGTGASIYVVFGLEIGSNYQGTLSTWGGANYLSGTGMSNTFLSSTSNYLYITGIQFEVGTQATSFDYRPYGTELALCQRYFNKSFAQATAPANYTNSQKTTWVLTSAGGPGTYGGRWVFPVNMRAQPTITFYNPQASGTAGYWHSYTSSTEADQPFSVLSVTDTGWSPTLSGSTSQIFAYGEFTASAEL